MKRSLKALTLVLALCLLLVGCSARLSNESAKGMYDTAAQSAPQTSAYSNADRDGAENNKSFDSGAVADMSGQALDTVLASRKIIRDANLSVQTLEFDKFIDSLTQSIAQIGGYISSSYVGGNSYYRQYLRSAEIQARIPADQLDAFLEGIGNLGNITSKNISVRDVTTGYVDTEAHLQALRTEQDALLKILASATTVEDLITVQNRLSDVRYEIESYESILRSYDDLIAMSTVIMNISEVERETAVTEETFWQEVSRRFSETLEDVGEGFKTFGIWFLGSLPAIVVWLVILGVIALIVIAIARGSRKRRERNAEKRRAGFEQRLRDTQRMQAGQSANPEPPKAPETEDAEAQAPDSGDEG